MIELTAWKKSNNLTENKKGTQVIQSCVWETKRAGILKKKGSNFPKLVVQVT